MHTPKKCLHVISVKSHIVFSVSHYFSVRWSWGFPLSLYIPLNSTKVPVPDCIPVMVLNYSRSALSHILPNLSSRSLVDLLKIYIVVASDFWSPWFKIRHTWESTSYYPIILPFLFLRSLRDLPLIEIGLVGTLRNNDFQCHYFLCQDFLTMIPDRKPFH